MRRVTRGPFIIGMLSAGLAMTVAGATALAQFGGPSSSHTAYVIPTVPAAKTSSILTVGDTVNGSYRMVGLPDGLGAFDNGDGTFTLLMNHELGSTQGIVRAHGSKG